VGSIKHGLGDVTKEELTEVSDLSKEIIRDLIIPEIEKEVNEGKVFANLRQIYNSMILAVWYKHALKESVLGQVYVDQNKTLGIDHKDSQANQKIYEQYLDAFKKGVFNFIKEDYDPATDELIPRKYFSGGTVPPSIGTVKVEKGDNFNRAIRLDAQYGTPKISVNMDIKPASSPIYDHTVKVLKSHLKDLEIRRDQLGADKNTAIDVEIKIVEEALEANSLDGKEIIWDVGKNKIGRVVSKEGVSSPIDPNDVAYLAGMLGSAEYAIRKSSVEEMSDAAEAFPDIIKFLEESDADWQRPYLH